jgi:hypothetical protein
MKDKVLILPIDSQTFQIENYSIEDVSLIATSSLDTEFSKETDYVEYYLFDENKNRIAPETTEALLAYTVRDGHVLLDPKQDLQREGFDEGTYFATYKFYRKHLSSDIDSKYYIEQISSDRTEIRLNSNIISNSKIEKSTKEFINYRETQEHFVDFYINFGDDNLAIANNIKLDVINEDNFSVIIKLYEPLPNNIQEKSQCWVVELVSSPQSYQVQFPISIFEPNDFEFLAGPNLDLQIKEETGIASKEHSLETLLNSNITGSNNQIQSLLNDKGLKININYEDFNNYTKFSSAKTRLENFYYKVGLIENFNNQISSLTSSIVSNSNLTSEFSSSKENFKSQIKNIINNFDSYEQFLYFSSGSNYTYPKSNITKPYTLQSTGSEEVKLWLGSANPNDPYYGGIALQAHNYDQNNQDYLYWSIPEYLRDDPNNAQYSLFIDMMGQHFDNIWVYTKDIVNKFNADNRLDYGISKDLVADAIKDFGIKLYSNNFNTNDLYEAFLGITSDGIQFPNTGSELINTQISASNDIIPLDDTNKRLYKRIYHNIPYLLKTKGTIAGLRALITSYGIPDTILRINEFGGKNKVNKQDWDYKQNIFNYALELDGTNYFSSSFLPNNDFSSEKPSTIQLRFKAPGIPDNHVSQSLFGLRNSGSLLLIEYTGSSNTSGSYSGSIADPYNEFGNIKFIPNIEFPNVSASVYLPIFDGDWWSVMTTVNSTASLYVSNNNENKLKYTGSDHLTTFSTASYEISNKIQIPHPENITIGSDVYLPFSGSIQEIRYYSSSISESAFQDFVLNPYSYKGNSFTTPNDLIFRADLGTLSNTSSRESIHPKVTGSWVSTSSFSSDSLFYISSGSFLPNKEFIHLNQSPQGIKNKINDRIEIFNNTIPTGDTLSSKRSLQQYSHVTQSTTPDADYLEVAFSPSDQINDDIVAELGHFNIGDYIGDPRHISESRTNYPDLDSLRDQYFLKYTKSYNVRDFIRLIKYFDNSLFKMIKDFTPARTNLSSGVIVKQHSLERNVYSSRPVSHEDQTYSGSVKSYVRNYSTGSGETGTYETVSGSTIQVFRGGTGGVFERFNGLEFAPSESYNVGPNNRFGITQSWFDVYKTTGSNNQLYVRDDQREFYNGEFSQSAYVKMQRGVNFKNDDPCYPYLNWENVPELLYRLEYFSGSDSQFSIVQFTPPPPVVLNAYFVSHPETQGTTTRVTPDGSGSCQLTSSNFIYTNVSNITNITFGTTFFSDVAGTLPWTGSDKNYGIREINRIYNTLNTSGSNYFNNLYQLGTTNPFTGSKFTGSYSNSDITYTGVSTYGGIQSGTNATFDVTTNSGSITSININNVGSGYEIGDTFLFTTDILGGSRLTTNSLILNVDNTIGGIANHQNEYTTGSYAITASSTTSTTATNIEWELTFSETLLSPEGKGKLTNLIATNVGEGVKIGDTFTWSSDELNEYLINLYGAPLKSDGDFFNDISQTPGGTVAGTYNVNLTGDGNEVAAQASITLDPDTNLAGVTLTTLGSGYQIGDTITIPSGSLGATAGGGSDLVFVLTAATVDLAATSNGVGDYVLTITIPTINSNSNQVDIETVELQIDESNFNYELEDNNNHTSVEINDSGVVTDIFGCKFNRYFKLREYEASFNDFVYAGFNSAYIIGNYVTLNEVLGCYEIVGTIQNELPAIELENTYTINSSCTPSTTLENAVYLRYSSTSTTACTSNAQVTIYIDGLYFSTSTKLYTSTIGITDNYAESGYYSDGVFRRYWNSSTGQLGYAVSCTSTYDPNSFLDELDVNLSDPNMAND